MYFLIPHNTSEVCIICAYIVLGFLSLAAISTIKTGWAGLQIGHLSGVRRLRRTLTVPGTSSGASVGPLAGCMLRLAAVAFIPSVCNRFFSPDSPSSRQQSPLKHLYGCKAGAPGVRFASGCLDSVSQNSRLSSFCLKRHFCQARAPVWHLYGDHLHVQQAASAAI